MNAKLLLIVSFFSISALSVQAQDKRKVFDEAIKMISLDESRDCSMTMRNIRRDIQEKTFMMPPQDLAAFQDRVQDAIRLNDALNEYRIMIGELTLEKWKGYLEKTPKKILNYSPIQSYEASLPCIEKVENIAKFIIANNDIQNPQISQNSKISKYLKGEAAVVFDYKTDPSNLPKTEDCSTYFSNSKNIVYVTFLEKNRQLTYSFWGGKASDEEKGTAMVHLSNAGKLVSSEEVKTQQSDVNNLKLVTLRQNGVQTEYIFKSNASDDNILLFSQPRTIDGPPKEIESIRFIEKNLRQNFGEYKISFVCSVASLRPRIQKLEDTKKFKGQAPDAMEYVLDKRWSSGLNCRLGNYEMFSKNLAGGHQFFARNDGLNKGRMNYEIKRLNDKTFIVDTTYFGTNPIVVSGQMVPAGYTQRKVTLVDAKTVKVESKSKTIDLFSKQREQIRYDESVSSSTLELCDM